MATLSQTWCDWRRRLSSRRAASRPRKQASNLPYSRLATYATPQSLMSDRKYPGGELDLFAHADHWKAYWSSQLRPFIGRSVLEIGAGIGSNTTRLCQGTEERWICLEPDPLLAARLMQTVRATTHCGGCEGRTGCITSLAADEQFDTLLYIDVLEHIPDDRGEVRRAAGHLKPGGHLIILSPAHNWL